MILTGLKYLTRSLSRSIWVVAAIVAMTMMSCGEDVPVSLTGEDRTGVVEFSVLTYKNMDIKGLSRVADWSNDRLTWSDGYESLLGDTFDTALLKDQLYVVITDADCTREYAVTNLICTRTTETALTVTYDFRGRVPKEDLAAVSALSDGKLHIVANAGYNPVLSSGSDISFRRYGQPDNSFTSIPMWGVKEFDFSALAPNSMLNVGSVSLLRSMAKVVIEAADGVGMDKLKLSSVEISEINTEGYLLPQGWTGIRNTESLERNAVRIPAQTAIGPVRFQFVDNHVEFYLPEMRNAGGNREIKMDVVFNAWFGDRHATLYFRPYVNGEPDGAPYDVRRNYLYRYKVDTPQQLGLSAVVDVVPYTSVELDPEFGFITPLPSNKNEGDQPGLVIP